MKKIVLGVLLLLTVYCKAQAQTLPSTDLQNFMAWLQTQQAYVGTALPIHGKLVENAYVATWWDAIQYGDKGFNIGKGAASDFVDLGVTMDTATGQITRWGATVPVHFGNIWNLLASKLPSGAASHFNITALPNCIIAPQFLIPVQGRWTWYNDFKVTVAYRFGGS